MKFQTSKIKINQHKEIEDSFKIIYSFDGENLLKNYNFKNYYHSLKQPVA